MTENKEGLRKMMHLSGLNSFEYLFGMLIADTLLFLIPLVVFFIMLYSVPLIMELALVWKFTLCYALFGPAMISLTYLMTKLFDNPETGMKYISTISSLALLMAPIAISFLFAAIFHENPNTLSTIFGIFYCVNPMTSLLIQTFFYCSQGKEGL